MSQWKRFGKIVKPVIFISAGFLIATITFQTSSVGKVNLWPFSAGSKKPGLVTFNQTFIEQIRNHNLDLENIDGMFEMIFTSLPNEVKVYPTENYYYFKMFANGGDIWGNMRLDSIDREEGILNFAYFFVNPNGRERYYSRGKTYYKEMDKSQGVTVEKKDHLTYNVSYKGKTVTFHLNDLEQKLPKDLKIHEGETLVGRTCDESGFQFFMVFNEKTKSFYYILDETIPLADVLKPYGKDILVGQLSEFAFYDEPNMNRRILFAVRERNIARNNYYDGPFDQLADNFVNANEFERMVGEAFPYQKGRVKGRGDFVDEQGRRGSTRISVSSYIEYYPMVQLFSHMAGCQETYQSQPELTACITTSYHYKASPKKYSKTIEAKQPKKS